HTRDPGGLPGYRARPQRALGPVARVRHACARRGLSTGLREIPLARPLFEELLAERVGAPYVAAVSSGTAGLHLLARIAGLGPGDEAITSPISFASSANCFIFEGAAPVFAD